MGRHAPAMSTEDLRRVLVDKAKRNDYVEDYGPIDEDAPDLDRIVTMLLHEELIGEVEKDWSKIDFSTENTRVVAERLTPEGVPHLVIRAGGDWETPLICVLYFDGTKLRGYVPKSGNTYNHARKAAFGNHSSDAAACAKQFGIDATEGNHIEVEPDMDLVQRDIDARIEAKGTYEHRPVEVASKATLKARRQARIEKDQDLSGPITKDMVHAVISLAAGGSYVEFRLRSSRRELSYDEADRLVGVPTILRRTEVGSGRDRRLLWYSPMDCYPIRTQEILEAAGFVKAPDNDLSQYVGARTMIIRI